MKRDYKPFAVLTDKNFINSIQNKSFCKNCSILVDGPHIDFSYDLIINDGDTNLEINFTNMENSNHILKMSLIYDIFHIADLFVKYHKNQQVKINAALSDNFSLIKDFDISAIIDYYMKHIEQIITDYENERLEKIKSLIGKAVKYSKIRGFNV